MFGTGVSGIHATCRFSFCFFPGMIFDMKRAGMALQKIRMNP